MTQAQENYYVDRGLTPLQPDYIEKLKLQANIILGDFIFNTVDEYGVVWVVTDIQGWWRPPSAEMPNIQRGFGDGSYDVQGRYAARELVINGTFLTQSPSQVEAARDRLIAATNLVYTGAWLKTGSDPIRASYVRLSGDVEIQTTNARGRTEFSIGLRAADPIKYSWNDANPSGYETLEVPVRNLPAGYDGIGSVTNIGNYSVPCIIEITGPLSSPATIYNRTTDELILIPNGQALKGGVTRSLSNKQLAYDTAKGYDIATLTTSVAHGFTVNESVFISGVGQGFDGEQIILSIPTDTTFTFSTDLSVVREVSFKSLTNGVATIETTAPHTFTTGESITVNGVDSVFDGTHVVLATPTESSFTFAKTRVPPQTVVGKVIISNIATLTTADDHQFIVGDSVTVSGVDVNFNGTYTITGIPSSKEFSYAATRTNARSIVQKVMGGEYITFVTSLDHGFSFGETVNVSGVDETVNGTYTIYSILTPRDFTVKKTRVTEKTVAVKSKTSNVVTLTTSDAHGFLVGEKVRVQGVDFSQIDGDFTITAVPSSTTFSYTKSGSDIISTSVTDPFPTVRPISRKIKASQLVSNIATITTVGPHGMVIDESITLTGLSPALNGTYTVLSTPSTNTFTYAKTGDNEAYSVISGDAFVQFLGSSEQLAVVPDGIATVAGSLPFTGTSGTASVAENIVRVYASGKAVKKNDIQFTPGLTGATAVLQADVLEIDTKNREVAFNGLVEGARNRVDVLVDFIQLAPGINQLEFVDEGNSEGTATLRVLYRSGWLG
jgi:hypothetical protein